MRLGREAENSCQITSEFGAGMMFFVSLPEMQYVAEERNSGGQDRDICILV